MKKEHLQFGRKLGKLSATLLMLVFNVLMAVSAYSQSPLANNLVTFNLLSGGTGGANVTNAAGVGSNRATYYRTGFSGATLDTIVLSHVPGVISGLVGTTYNQTTAPISCGYNTIAAGDNCIRVQSVYGSSSSTTVATTNAAQMYTPNFIQTAVVLGGGKTFDASATLQLEVISSTSLGAISATVSKGYQIYYKYYKTTPSLVNGTTPGNDTISLNPSASTYGASGSSVADAGSATSIANTTTSGFTVLNEAQKNGATGTLSGFATYNDNTVSIPAPPDNSYTCVVIQIRLWGTGSTATANNWRLAYLGLTTATAPSVPSTLVTPTITSLSTSSVYAGAAATTLSINGTGFDNTTPTAVTFNGTTKVVSYKSSTQITIPLTATDLQTAGTYAIVVSNGIGYTATTNFTVNADPTVTITNVTQPSAANIAQAATKSNLQAFVINNTSSALATLNTIKAHFTGTYTANDIANFKLYYSTTNSLSGATSFVTASSATTNTSSATTGSETVTFTLGTTLAAGNNYFWVTVTPDAAANIVSPVSTINATALSSSDFSFTTTTVTFNAISVGGVQTIVQGTTQYMDDITTQPSGTIAQNGKKVTLAGFYINPYGTTVFSGINIYGTGNATSTEITNLAIYKDVDNSGTYTAGDVLASTNTPTYSTSAAMAFTLNQTLSSKTQFIIVADIADVNVSTINHTVLISMNDQDFTVSTYTPSGSFNAANSLSIAAPTATSTIATSAAAATISSVANTTGSAVSAYSFTYHSDNTNSGANSLISQIVITQSGTNTISGWSGVISGATLTDDAGNSITGTVGSSTITFSTIPTTVGALGYVANNSTKTYTLKIVLSSTVSPSTLKNTLSGSVLGFALIPANVTVTGNVLATSQSTINSGSTNGVISVVGTKLVYIAAPGSENVNITLNPSVTVQAEDANGNYDLTYITPISIASTPSGISGTLTGTPTSGLATFANLVFGTTGSYTVTATSGSLTSAVQAGVVISNSLYFRGGVSSASWEATNNWAISAGATPSANWTDGYAAALNGTATTVTVGSAHSLPSLSLNTTGYTVTGTGTLTLTSSTPEIDINGDGILACPLAASSNLAINQIGTSGTLTIGSATATSAATNYYTANFGGTTTVGSNGSTSYFSKIALKANNPFGSSASNTLIWNAPSGSTLAFTGAESYTAPASIFPISIASNIVLPTGTVVTVGPTGASVYGNLIKYMGSISGNTKALNFSNTVGYGTSGKGNVYFGGKNTYTGSTLMYGNNASLVLGGGDNTLPAGTDVVFWTGASGYPVIDLRGSNETISSINSIDATTTQTATTLHGAGFFNGSLMLPSYAVTSTSVTVKTSDVAGYTANGTLVFGAGIPYGTVVSGTSSATVSGDACTVLALTPPSGKSITTSLLNTGFPVFFEDPNNPVYKTLSIEGTGTTGGNFGTSTTINRTISTFNATINGKINLALTSNNNASNVLTLGNANSYTGTTTVTSGKLVLAYTSGNTLPATNSAIIDGNNGVLEIKTNQTLANLTISAGTLLIDAGATLTITGTFTNTGGTVTNNGTFTYSSATALTTGGTTINNNGTFNVTAANLVLSTGTFTNAASSTVSVTNNTINVTGGVFNNNGAFAATSNITSSGGYLNLNTNQTLGNLTMSAGGTVNIANNTTTTINGTLTYGGGVANTGNLTNSGTIAYGSAGTLAYASVNTHFNFNNAYEFTSANPPVTLTLPVGDTILLDNDYLFPGNLVLNGVISAGNSFLNPNTLTLTGTAKTITGTGKIGSIKIDGTISVPTGNSLSILNKLTLSSGTLTTNNNVTLKSTSIDSTAVVDVVASGLINGNITVERYIPKGFRSYRDIAPQVYGAGSIFANWQESGSFTNKGYGIFITGSTAADASKTYYNTPSFNSTTGLDYSINGNASVFTFSNPADAWTAVTNTKSTNLDPFQAYRVAIRGDRTFNLESTVLTQVNGSILMVNATTLRATGKLITGTVKYNTAGVTATAADGSAITSGVTLKNSIGSFDMIANPYACPVTWGTGTLTNSSSSTVYGASTNLNGTYWYFDPTSAASGSYIAFNAITGSSSHTGVSSTGIIQAGQTVFVQARANSPEVVFTEGSKVATSTKAKVFGITTPISKIYVSLKKQSANTYKIVDGAAVAFSSSFGNTTYGAQDAYKFGNGNDNLSILDKGTNLSIDGRLPATTADVLPIALAKLNNASYQLEIDATNYNGLSPVLKDNFKGTVTDLTIGVNTIDFVADSLVAASYASRFTLGFKPTTLAVNSIVATASLNNKVATISWNTVGEKNVSRFEVEKSTDAVSFTKIAQATAKNTTSAAYTTTDNSVTATTYYRIKAISEVGTVSYSNVIKLSTFDSQLSTYSLYPNPLKGSKVLNVSLSNVGAGKYTVALTNVLGQKVQEAAISHNGGNASHAITVNNTLAAGTYSVTIRESASGKIVNQSNLSVN